MTKDELKNTAADLLDLKSGLNRLANAVEKDEDIDGKANATRLMREASGALDLALLYLSGNIGMDSVRERLAIRKEARRDIANQLEAAGVSPELAEQAAAQHEKLEPKPAVVEPEPEPQPVQPEKAKPEPDKP